MLLLISISAIRGAYEAENGTYHVSGSGMEQVKAFIPLLAACSSFGDQ
jgi:hypothetical protein